MFLTNHLLRYSLLHGEELWLNSLTGAIDLLSPGEVAAVDRSLHRGAREKDGRAVASDGYWTGQDLEPLQDGLFLDRLVSRGYVFESRAAALSACRDLASKYIEQAFDSGGRSLIICPTYTCNLRCTYCFERNAPQPLPALTMDIRMADEAIAAFSLIRSRDPGRRYSLGLFGGEPLLPATRKIVSYTLAAAESMHLPVLIVTNGVNIPIFMDLIKRYARNVASLQLTIDGPPDVHDRRRPAAGGAGTFHAIAEAADLLLDAGMKVSLRVNIDGGNVSRLPRLRRIAEERGWTEDPSFSVSLAPVKNHLAGGDDAGGGYSESALLGALIDVYDRDPDTEELFGFSGIQSIAPVAPMLKTGKAGVPRVFHCEASYGGFIVAGPDGLLYACPEAAGHAGLAVGRFSPDLDIRDAEMSRWQGRNINTLAECAQCDVGPLCGGGCAYSSLSLYGGSRPQCDTDLKDTIGIFLRRRVLRRNERV